MIVGSASVASPVSLIMSPESKELLNMNIV